jgi:hypothetical protein
MPSPNDDPAFIKALAALVREVSGVPSRIGAR